MLAAVVSYLGGKLRDYRGHYGASLDEMELAVAVWSQCIVALQPADATPAAAAAGLRVQAQQLIEASVVRHVKRVRLALSRRPPPAAPAAPPPPPPAAEPEEPAGVEPPFASEPSPPPRAEPAAEPLPAFPEMRRLDGLECYKALAHRALVEAA